MFPLARQTVGCSCSRVPFTKKDSGEIYPATNWLAFSPHIEAAAAVITRRATTITKKKFAEQSLRPPNSQPLFCVFVKFGEFFKLTPPPQPPPPHQLPWFTFAFLDGGERRWILQWKTYYQFDKLKTCPTTQINLVWLSFQRGHCRSIFVCFTWIRPQRSGVGAALLLEAIRPAKMYR